ncbi:flavin-containing monooxygenase FMO GS-OX-like 4 isoform X2 [Phalaenopsis equestris]|uniref:flavin-containing monooxygenase FMO GS-OX-like 4 isoform X2 n=1 Tax=Phalaenopsis equestris TaxID=78828 RepID=UPI0009E2E4DC|nr:flavin-containing monooxygenase FMO GS-OX-like 4 isoform X2 [Phalaenopsis equestris]
MATEDISGHLGLRRKNYSDASGSPMPTLRALLPTTTALFPDSQLMFRRRIAVIGAGAAGLVAARELRREGHSVVVFERGHGVGGTWVYTPAIESDPLGLDPNRKIVHSSLYDSLRTNLPRECMGFSDYPFVAITENSDNDRRRFPGHREVLRYLEDFSRDTDLNGMIRFGTEVISVEMEGEGRWAVRSLKIDDGRADDETEVYEGVVVCNGHHTEPRIAEIPGIETWPGKQIHSHNYRMPQPFTGQVVVIIGSATSSADISRELAGFAKEVHVASRTSRVKIPMKQPGYDNLWLHSMIDKTFSDGTVAFQDGCSVQVDVIMHCTGYKYRFPFLRSDDIIDVDDNRVVPLYKHVFPPFAAPYISFIGLPWKVVPFPLCELQSRWVAGVLSGRIALPAPEEMMGDVKAFYSDMEQAKRPKRYTHNIADYQFEYDDWLASQCGCPPVEEWRKQMYEETAKNRIERPESYRDEWEDDDLVAAAYHDFKNS